MTGGLTWADGTSDLRSASALENFLLWGATDSIQFCSGDGSDSRSGRGPGQAKLTIEAAYGDLPTTGGAIILADDRFDVGDGLIITRGDKKIDLQCAVAPPGHIGSTTKAPLAAGSATLYTSTGAASLVSFTGGSASAVPWGSLFRNLIFEFSDPATKIGIDAPSARFVELDHCYGFADFTSPVPAAVDAQLIWARGENAYGGGSSEASWGRMTNCKVNAMALGTFGNPTGTKLSNNQWVIEKNVGFGISTTDVGQLPMISVYGAHRFIVRDNNCEFFETFLLMDHSFGCFEDGDGGERTLIWLDLYSVQGCNFRTSGISWSPLGSTTPYVPGAIYARGDVGVQNNIFTLPSTSDALDTHRLYRPTDDSTQPAIALANPDNIVISPRYSTDFMRRSGTLTSTPGAVSTLNIPHGMSSAFTGGAGQVTPVNFGVDGANANAAAAPAFYVTSSGANLTLNFASALTAATSYSWRWWASAR